MIRSKAASLCVGAMVLGAGCANDAPVAEDSTAESSVNRFGLEEWSVTPPAGPMGGTVQLTAVNNGSQIHELVFVRADSPAALPTKADGSVDEDQIPEADKPGEIEDVDPGRSKSRTLKLAPGRYVAFCNLVDETGARTSHFKSGMAASFTLR